MARILKAMFGGMFLERDPFDVGPGLFLSSISPSSESAADAIHGDWLRIRDDMYKAGLKVYCHA